MVTSPLEEAWDVHTAKVAQLEREMDDRRMAQLREQIERECFGARPRYATCSLENFERATSAHEKAAAAVAAYARSVSDRIASGDSVILYGPCGTGKDHLLAALVRSAIEVNRRVAWRCGLELFREARDRIDAELPEGPFVAALVRPDVLCVSDPLPPFGDLSQFQATLMLDIVNGRYDRGRPTWITVNVKNRIELETRLGAQAVDRLSHGALSVFCNWATYRQPAK